jgi:diguanylate cyclase (GGDEF)-like protein
MNGVRSVERALEQSRDCAEPLDAVVEDRLGAVGSVSTVAVARWMTGDDPERARQVVRESWPIFGELAAQGVLPLQEVMKRCLYWSGEAEAVVRQIAAELQIPQDVCALATGMVQRSLSVTVVRICESFEAERKRTEEERARREQELAFMATHDSLTKLPNRTLILDRLEQMLVRSNQNRMPVAAFFIDLDDFKSINDSFGHGAGDELLRSVAQRLAGVVRDVDTLGRLSGDEFVLLASETSLAAGPKAVAERLLDALRAPFELAEAETPLVVTASIGIEMGEQASARELLGNADVAMYRAKWAGKNRYFLLERGDGLANGRGRAHGSKPLEVVRETGTRRLSDRSWS